MSAHAISRLGAPRATHVSLFAGVGMLDLAAEGEGFETLATAEVLPFNRKVLAARFPGAKHYHDVKEVTSWRLRADTGFLGRVDLLSGGFPCQDASDAGTKLGLGGERTGLWSEFLRIINDLQPSYVIGENVASLRSRGLDLILYDLYCAGYDVRWECIPAAYVGANHLRDRCWIMAKRVDGLGNGLQYPNEFEPLGPIWAAGFRDKLPRAGRMVKGTVYETKPLTTVKQARPDGRKLLPTPTKSDGTGGPGTTPKRTGGKNLRTVAKEIEGNGRLNPLYVEYMMGLPLWWTDPSVPNSQLSKALPWVTLPWVTYDGIGMTTDKNVPNRSARIQALGNGLVPQVARVALRILLND